MCNSIIRIPSDTSSKSLRSSTLSLKELMVSEIQFVISQTELDITSILTVLEILLIHRVISLIQVELVISLTELKISLNHFVISETDLETSPKESAIAQIQFEILQIELEISFILAIWLN